VLKVVVLKDRCFFGFLRFVVALVVWLSSFAAGGGAAFVFASTF
jgi:hypothetical protein